MNAEQTRVYEYIKDHPGTTTLFIVSDFGVRGKDAIHISAILLQLFDDGQLTRQEQDENGIRFFQYWVKG